MANLFKKRRWKSIPWFVYGIGLFVLLLTGFELYQWIVPFQPRNPFFHEATIGQSVIQNWKYEGLDEQGYLRFYDNFQTAILPPKSRIFDANGQFVVIEHYTTSSIVFAQPIEAIPAKWAMLLFLVICSFVFGLSLRIKQRFRMMRLRYPLRPTERRKKLRTQLRSGQSHRTSKRFRAKTRKSKSKL